MKLLKESSLDQQSKYVKLDNYRKRKYLNKYLKSLDNYKYLEPFLDDIEYYVYQDDGLLGDTIKYIEKLDFKIPGNKTLNTIFKLLTLDKLKYNDPILYDKSLYKEPDNETEFKIKTITYSKLNPNKLKLDELKNKNGTWKTAKEMNELINSLDQLADRSESNNKNQTKLNNKSNKDIYFGGQKISPDSALYQQLVKQLK